MNVPEPLREADGQDSLVRSFEYDDREDLVVVDFGQNVATDDGVSIDVLDSRVIVVAGDRQLEFDLPATANDVTVHNGVLTIEGDAGE
ncbi:DUF7127 family protein [Natronobacterium texcoconense]|uniref:Hsp20/alpha crystallin family protein n=1 Tax=Natronobacterium texcoconense TaxID=1095778 RepID=A0A1H1HYS8_NATTX|nr:hypothetical protein [Natronobacterium texcoconense]SDR30550.1 hypothetical protein SAMN04489842_3159 [Natronobacterium texcoconense]